MASPYGIHAPVHGNPCPVATRACAVVRVPFNPIPRVVDGAWLHGNRNAGRLRGNTRRYLVAIQRPRLSERGLSHEAGGRDACPPKRAPRPVVDQREFSRPSRFQPRDGPHRRIGIDEKPVARDVVADAGKRTQGALRGDVHRLFADNRRHGDALRGTAAAGHALSRVREHRHAGDPRSDALVHLAVRPASRTRSIAEQRA